MSSALLRHVLEVVRGAPRRERPFAHQLLEGLLPADFYAELLASIPDPQRFEPLYHKDALRPDGSTTRSTFTLEAGELAALPPPARACLEACRQAFASAELRDALFARYADVLRDRFPVSPSGIAATVKLQRDEPGYRIGVHPDTSDKVLLVQLYLAPDDSHPEMGTALYRRDGASFAKVDTLPFRSNTGYSFARTEETWHGVEAIGALRHSLTLNYRLESQRLRRGFKKRVLRQISRLATRVRGS
jgi:hypothetical protein